MNLLRYYEAKHTNRSTVELLRVLDRENLLQTLPGAMGDHYRRFDRDSDNYDPIYCSRYERDRYLMNILTCANDIQAIVARNGDIKVVGAQHCGHKHLCACCGTREARRVASQLRYMFFLNRSNDLDYYMLTLTLPNRHDGFREEFKIYDKCLTPILSYMGSKQSMGAYNYIRGFFASRELTYTEEKGFHPHIHIIIAYDRKYIGDVKYTRNGCIKKFDLLSKRGKSFSALSIRDHFQSLILKYFPEYYEKAIRPLRDGLNIDFRHIDDIDNSCDELCKYFIDYNCFSSPDSLLIYMRDIYNLRKYTKRGCFGWSEELEESWRKWCALGKPTEQNFHFIQLAGHFDTKHFVYFGMRKVLYNNKLIDFPCYYRRDDLVCSGDPFMLHYDSFSRTYQNTIYDTSTGRLCKLAYTESGARVIKTQAFNDEHQRHFDYFMKRLKSDPDYMSRSFNIDIFTDEGGCIGCC